MNWAIPYPCRLRSDSVRRINMSSEPGNESFLCALRPIPRILSLRHEITRIKFKRAQKFGACALAGPEVIAPPNLREPPSLHVSCGDGATLERACGMVTRGGARRRRRHRLGLELDDWRGRILRVEGSRPDRGRGGSRWRRDV